jgi:predicted DNA-binding antitoxin AbrB/MazE fold protein
MSRSEPLSFFERITPMKVIHAVFENGVFRPTEPVDLPEGFEVTVNPKEPSESGQLSPHARRIYPLLNEPMDTSDPGFSERHDEHQP